MTSFAGDARRNRRPCRFAAGDRGWLASDEVRDLEVWRVKLRNLATRFAVSETAGCKGSWTGLRTDADQQKSHKFMPPPGRVSILAHDQGTLLFRLFRKSFKLTTQKRGIRSEQICKELDACHWPNIRPTAVMLK